MKDENLPPPPELQYSTAEDLVAQQELHRKQKPSATSTELLAAPLLRERAYFVDGHAIGRVSNPTKREQTEKEQEIAALRERAAQFFSTRAYRSFKTNLALDFQPELSMNAWRTKEMTPEGIRLIETAGSNILLKNLYDMADWQRGEVRDDPIKDLLDLGRRATGDFSKVLSGVSLDQLHLVGKDVSKKQDAQYWELMFAAKWLADLTRACDQKSAPEEILQLLRTDAESEVLAESAAHGFGKSIQFTSYQGPSSGWGPSVEIGLKARGTDENSMNRDVRRLLVERRSILERLRNFIKDHPMPATDEGAPAGLTKMGAVIDALLNIVAPSEQKHPNLPKDLPKMPSGTQDHLEEEDRKSDAPVMPSAEENIDDQERADNAYRRRAARRNALGVAFGGLAALGGVAAMSEVHDAYATKEKIQLAEQEKKQMDDEILRNEIARIKKRSGDINNEICRYHDALSEFISTRQSDNNEDWIHNNVDWFSRIQARFKRLFSYVGNESRTIKLHENDPAVFRENQKRRDQYSKLLLGLYQIKDELDEVVKKYKKYEIHSEPVEALHSEIYDFIEDLRELREENFAPGVSKAGYITRMSPKLEDDYRKLVKKVDEFNKGTLGTTSPDKSYLTGALSFAESELDALRNTSTETVPPGNEQ